MSGICGRVPGSGATAERTERSDGGGSVGPGFPYREKYLKWSDYWTEATDNVEKYILNEFFDEN